ncbi:aminopeptidase [Selenomonadales bacterium OttesenSCG-928-I06]|nr:aminopeptidase [Selenomonadales bacterium OttesenSCG-928-I06]
MDERIQTLAYNLINYSTKLQKNEKILIEVFDDAYPLAIALIEESYKKSAIPFLNLKNNKLQRTLLKGAYQEQMSLLGDYESFIMNKMDAYIGIRASNNISEFSDIPTEKMNLYQNFWAKKVHTDIRVKNTKWCVMRYPNESMAQLANMSTEAFEDFYYNVCNLDYAKMAKAMIPLINLMNNTDKVRITGPNTDLSFSIKKIGAVPCSGLRNIPDGEVYTAPIKNSVNGHILYNTPSVYQGTVFENVYLEFKEGKITKATANETEKLNRILDTDEGARYIGEFALGINPYIEKPMKDILFDEKIKGSFHFTPGSCYDSASNGNQSAVHWDLVFIQTKEYGGGEIFFDDKLIRKDGIFVIPELEGLNPENLI